VSSISAQGVGPDCVPSLEKLRASLVLVFSADHGAFRAGVQRVVFFVVMFRVVVLIASFFGFSPKKAFDRSDLT